MLFLLPLCLLASGASSLVIQFDGSLRLPRDPIRGFSSTGLDKIASCGSAILLDDVDDGGGDGDDRRRRTTMTTVVLAIGGRSIPLVPDMTSGDVEYDGLNLGLEWTVRAAEGGELDEVWWGTAASDNGNDDNNGVAKAAAPVLVIRGDCKTVIDHLNGVAAPRKLRPKYEIAQECIGRLKDYGRRRFGGDGIIVRFEHVPRRENVLCDALCVRVIDAKLAETIGTALEAIRGGEESSMNPTTRLELPASKKKRFKVTVTHFDRALDVISGSGRIPYSVRLGLYREVARAADRSDDGVALRRLGAVLITESKRWPPQINNDDDNGSILTSGKDVKRLGILLGVAGLRRMDLNKEANQAERKNRVVALNDNDEPDLVSAFLGDTNTLGARGKVQALLSPSWTGEDIEGGEWSNLLNSWYGVACELIQNRVEGSSIERGFWFQPSE